MLQMPYNERSLRMKRTLLVATAAAIAGGVTAFSIASYASSDEKPPASSAGDAYTAAALDLADTSSTATPPSPSPSGKGAGGSAKSGQHAQFQHGEAVVRDKDGKLITVDRQRGSVTAASATSLTVKSSDGTSWTWTIDKDTKVRGPNLKTEPASSVKVGNTVAVGGQRSGDTRTARAVIDPPPTAKDLRGDLRKLRRDLRILRRY
jgi:hypothetical protein